MQLSKLEYSAYEMLKKNNLSIFKSKDLRLLLNIDKINIIAKSGEHTAAL